MTNTLREFRGQFADIMVIAELRGSYPNVPISADVDYAELIAGDSEPQFLTIPIGKVNAKSGNQRYYDEAFVTELMRQTLAMKPIGLMGHLSEAERATAFPKESLHWVGAVRDGDLIWGKAYLIGEARERVRRYKASGKSIATSIDAYANGLWDESLQAYRMEAASLRLNQIDLAPADRAGIPELARIPMLTTEMGTPAKDSEQEHEVSKEEVIQELSRATVQPMRGWQPPSDSQSASEIVAIREMLGVDEKADLPKLIGEMRQAQVNQAKAAVKARIVEMATPDPKRPADQDVSVKVEAVRAVVIEMVEAKQPATVQEAETAYQSVISSGAVTELLKSKVIQTMGPPQGTPVAGQNGKTGKYFNIPEPEKEGGA